MVLTALLVMMGVTLAQNLGLAEAMARVIGKISGCHMCCTFWSVMAVGLLLHWNIIAAAGLSIAMAYMSHWFALILILFNGWHERLRILLRRRRRRS